MCCGSVWFCAVLCDAYQCGMVWCSIIPYCVVQYVYRTVWWRTLQYGIVWYGVGIGWGGTVYGIGGYGTVWYGVGRYHIVRYDTAHLVFRIVWYGMLQCCIERRSMVWCSTIPPHCGYCDTAVLNGMVWYGTVLYGMIRRGTLWYCLIWHMIRSVLYAVQVGMVRYDMTQKCSVLSGTDRFSAMISYRICMARYGAVRYSTIRYGMVR